MKQPNSLRIVLGIALTFACVATSIGVANAQTTGQYGRYYTHGSRQSDAAESWHRHVAEAEKERRRQERHDRAQRFKSDVRKALAGNGIAGQGKKWGRTGISHGRKWGQH